MDASYLKLIRSDRVRERTRDVLLDRAQPTDSDYQPKALSVKQFVVLKEVVRLLIPQDAAGDRVELTERLDGQRADATTDGWRYANMPPDKAALGLGIDAIEKTAQSRHGRSFLDIENAQRIALLEDAQRGDATWPLIDSKRWFEDLLADVTEIYVSHPSTLAAMGFSGIAFLPAWPTAGLDTTQPWEPDPAKPKESQ